MTIDLALRGAAAGASLILAAALAPLVTRSLTARFGALFALSAAAYGIASAQAMITILPGVTTVLKVPAMAAGVFSGGSLWRCSAIQIAGIGAG